MNDFSKFSSNETKCSVTILTMLFPPILQNGSRIVVTILDDYNSGQFTYKLLVK